MTHNYHSMGVPLSTVEIDSSESYLFEGITYPLNTTVDHPSLSEMEMERFNELQKNIIVQYRGCKTEDGEIDPVCFTSNLILLCSSCFTEKDRLVVMFAVCAFLTQDGIISSILAQSSTEETKKKFVSALKNKLEEIKTLQNNATFHKNIEIILQWLEWDDSLEIKEPSC